MNSTMTPKIKLQNLDDNDRFLSKLEKLEEKKRDEEVNGDVEITISIKTRKPAP